MNSDNLAVLFPLSRKAKFVLQSSQLLSLSDPEDNVYHAAVWPAPHQALRGLPEDRTFLCSREPQAGGPGPYPSDQCLDHGHLHVLGEAGKLCVLLRPGRRLRGFILKPGGRTWHTWLVMQNCRKQLLSNCDLRGEFLLTFSPQKMYKQPGATKSILKCIWGLLFKFCVMLSNTSSIISRIFSGGNFFIENVQVHVAKCMQFVKWQQNPVWRLLFCWGGRGGGDADCFINLGENGLNKPSV